MSEALVVSEVDLADKQAKSESRKLTSDAAVDRRLQKLFVRSVDTEAFWDVIGFAGGLYFSVAPLQSELRKLARRNRNKPEVFFASLRRLVETRCANDPEYSGKFGWFLHFCDRLTAEFRESTPAEGLKLTKYQRRKKAEMVELLALFFPLSRTPSDGDAKRAIELLNKLPKVGPGRVTDEIVRKALAFREKGLRGRKTVARLVLGDSVPKEQIEGLVKKIAKAEAYRRKSVK